MMNKNSVSPGSFLLLFAGSMLLGTTAAAQEATATVRVAPVRPGPPESLQAEPTLPHTFLPNAKDVVVMEVEFLDATGGWVEETALSGFGGESYFRWNGSNQFNNPGLGLLEFNFMIETPGRYLVRVHVRHDHPDPSSENDVWARLEGEPWEKLFHNGGSAGVGVWTFNPIWESTKIFPDYQFSAGLHTFQLSGRSKNFKIDRIHVLPYNTWFAQLANPESELLRDRPLIGQSLRVEVDDPTDAAGLTPGQALSAVYVGLPHPNSPGGVLLPYGEMLLAALPAPYLMDAPEVWAGPEQPSVHVGNIPANVSLIGMDFTLQAVLFEPGTVVLTDAIDLVLGNM